MEGFKISLIRSEEHSQSYCNKIFAGWDFCITSRSMADLKHSSLRYELRVSAAGVSSVASLPEWSCLGRQVCSLQRSEVGARWSPVLSKSLLCGFPELFAAHSFLGLITLGSSMELVQWGWEERWGHASRYKEMVPSFFLCHPGYFSTV